MTNKVIIGRFLVAQGADKNHACCKLGNSALYSAISSLHCEFVDMPLDQEVNVLHVNLTGSTVLHWIARWGDCRAVKKLQRESSYSEAWTPDKKIKPKELLVKYFTIVSEGLMDSTANSNDLSAVSKSCKWESAHDRTFGAIRQTSMVC